jgi:hypothetical protein
MSGLKFDARKVEKDLARKEAGNLIEYLNHPERLNERGQEELRKIRVMLLALVELQRREMNGDPIFGDEPEMAAVNGALATYKWITQLHVGDGQYLYFTDDPAEESADTSERLRDVANGLWAARWFSTTVVSLANESMLQRIRPCSHCGTWFFGVGLYCSPQHKQAAYRAKPEVKKARCEYQKNYYRDILSPVTSKFARRKRRKAS